MQETKTTIELFDSYGPTGIYFDNNQDTLVLLNLVFLRSTKNLPELKKIAEPFLKIKKLAIRWQSVGWAADHITWMPSVFPAVETLTLLSTPSSTEIPVVAKWGDYIDVSPHTSDYVAKADVSLRKTWIQEAYTKWEKVHGVQRESKELDIKVMALCQKEKPPKIEETDYTFLEVPSHWRRQSTGMV